MGVNRLSMGVQSFDNEILKVSGRVHLAEDVLRAWRLIEEFDWTHDELAGEVGKKRETVSNALRLLNLEAEVQQAVIEGAIIDKNVCIGKNVRVINDSNRDETDLKHPDCVIRDGIPIIVKNAELPDDWDLEKEV